MIWLLIGLIVGLVIGLFMSRMEELRMEQDMPNSKSRWYETAKADNLSRFDVSRSMEHCTVVTFDGIPGFMWYDHLGNRHNEGLNWPKMNVIRDATVELLYDSETGEHSAGWKRKNDESEDDL